MEAIVTCVLELIRGGVIDVKTVEELKPYLVAIERHYAKGVEKTPAGWVNVALETATRVYVATRNKDVFIKTFYTIVDAYPEIGK